MKDGFDKTIRGIELLKKYEIDVKINGSLVKKNFHDRMEIIDIGEKYDIPVGSILICIHPCVSGQLLLIFMRD